MDVYTLYDGFGTPIHQYVNRAAGETGRIWGIDGRDGDLFVFWRVAHYLPSLIFAKPRISLVFHETFEGEPPELMHLDHREFIIQVHVGPAAPYPLPPTPEELLLSALGLGF